MPTLDLMQALRIASVSFQPRWQQEISGQASSRMRVADLGPELWVASLRTSDKLRKSQLLQMQARVNALRGSLVSFYAWNPLAEYPQADPGGVILGGATVEIDSLDAEDARLLTLKGLPAGYALTLGDFFAFDWGSDPVHRALHQIVGGSVTAGGGGVTPTIEVVPAIRPGAAEDIAVNLIRPAGEFLVTPGSLQAAMAGMLHGSLSFDAVQVA